MLPIRLEIRNFLAYRSPDPIYFDGIHLACLTGANGAGKSSLLDAITWVLWGKARARRDEDLVHLGQTDMWVQLDFVHEGGRYRVLRQRTRKAGGQGRLEFFSVNDDGELTTLNGESMRATQLEINKLLRLDYETFVHSAFLQQGKADAFTVKTPAERKKLLSDILGLERWSRYEDEVKERLRTINETLNSIEGAIHEIDRELAQEDGLRRQLAEAEIARQEAQSALEAAEALMAELESAPSEKSAAVERKAGQERQISERKRDLNDAAESIAAHQKRIAQYEAMIAQRDEIEQGYAALQAAQATFEQQSDKMSQLNRLDKQRAKLEKQIEAARGELRQEVSAYEATIRELERVIGAALPDELIALRAEILELEALDERREQIRRGEIALKEEQSRLGATNEKLKEDMYALKDRIDRLAGVAGAVCPLCGQPLDEAHRAELVAQLERDGKLLGDEHRTNSASVDSIRKEIKQNAALFKQMTDQLLRLPELKEQAGKLQGAVDEARAAASKLEEAQARRAAVLHTLETEQFALDVRAQVVDLDGEREALGYDDAQYDTARQQLDDYREYEIRRADLRIALDSVDGLRAQLQIAEARRDRLQGALADDEAALKAIELDIVRLERLVDEYRRREEEVKAQWIVLNKAHENLGIAQQRLNTIEEQKANKTRLESRRSEMRRARGLHEELQLAFGKKGIPAMIIETAIPELESGANAILARMTDGRMHVKLETQREKVSGGVSETLEIQIADELGTRSYDLYSGGEAFRINFALRVALSQLLARRSGAHLQTLFIDEGFGTQDEEGRAKLVEAITAVQHDFELILVITHIEDLRDSFPVHILLEKAGDGSRISVR